MPKRPEPAHISHLKGVPSYDIKADGKNDHSDLSYNSLPPAPGWLANEFAYNEWNRLGDILIRAKMLNAANINVFAVLCSIQGVIIEYLKDGALPNGHILNQYRSFVNDFGLTPTMQTKFAGFKDMDKPAANPFSQNGKRA